MLRGLAATGYRFVNEMLVLNKNFFPKGILPASVVPDVVDTVAVADKRGEFNVYEAFPIQNPWTKYTEIPYTDLSMWEKADRFVTLAYRSSMRYQTFGLLYDDILNDEDPMIIEALNRLPEEVRRAREKRLARAFDLSVNQKRLPREQWTKPEDDVAYLRPYVLWVRSEMEELDSENLKREDFLPFFRVSPEDYETGKAFKQRYID
ncbi:predicted protein [Naegleria gruberi]|uniref:Predicted protein n=1 Tax=Naegleria gruberi TaxID=5762 RepID=D2VSX2_NAEGR|nr:uncharacterized protein NAEGRDRAFT_81117 [Naegleria gruberi]EFC40052.1 predicted protein [Naegleria gruberi]|eukprot:XP_002672796.1 predicted protein [Naegleria gruberi strain NEG-M]